MKLKVLYFSSLLFAVLAAVPTAAHLLELPNKIDLARADYLVVQQIYRGWALLGFVIFGALLSILLLSIALRRRRRAFGFALVALACIIGAQGLFWTYTFPANQITENWTVLPENWAALRRQWEYSHAAAAILNLLAVGMLIASVLASDCVPGSRSASQISAA